MAAAAEGIGRLLREGKPRGWQEGVSTGQRAASEMRVAGESTADGSEEKREQEMG